jgi:hypothetical protein
MYDVFGIAPNDVGTLDEIVQFVRGALPQRHDLQLPATTHDFYRDTGFQNLV